MLCRHGRRRHGNGDELLGVPLPFEPFRLQAENLKGGGGGAAHFGDGWTAAFSEKATGQGQSVVRIRAIATLRAVWMASMTSFT